MLDKKTRTSHAHVDGEIRELEEKFSNGLLYPSDPKGKAEEVINCRCALLQRARWNLGSDYTKWDSKAPVVISDNDATQYSIIQAKNFEEFQKKYKQASERVRSNVQKIKGKGTSKIKELENIVKSSTIKLDLQFFAEKDIKNQESNSLKRAIRKYENRIQEHINKINDPKQFYEDWDSQSSLRQEGLKKHWRKEIRNFQNSINERIEELKERGDYDE